MKGKARVTYRSMKYYLFNYNFRIVYDHYHQFLILFVLHFMDWWKPKFCDYWEFFFTLLYFTLPPDFSKHGQILKHLRIIMVLWDLHTWLSFLLSSKNPEVIPNNYRYWKQSYYFVLFPWFYLHWYIFGCNFLGKKLKKFW